MSSIKLTGCLPDFSSFAFCLRLSRFLADLDCPVFWSSMNSDPEWIALLKMRWMEWPYQDRIDILFFRVLISICKLVVRLGECSLLVFSSQAELTRLNVLTRGLFCHHHCYVNILVEFLEPWSSSPHRVQFLDKCRSWVNDQQVLSLVLEYPFLTACRECSE